MGSLFIWGGVDVGGQHEPKKGYQPQILPLGNYRFWVRPRHPRGGVAAAGQTLGTVRMLSGWRS